MSSSEKLARIDLRPTIAVLRSVAQDLDDEGDARAARLLRDLLSVLVLRLEELGARPS
jgi:hypothetical protein